MKKGDYKREHKKLTEQKHKLQADLAAIDRRLTALEVVWTEVFNHNPSECPELSETNIDVVPDDDSFGVRKVPANGHTAQYVEEAVEAITTQFKVKDVIDSIQKAHPNVTVNNSTVAGKLTNLVDKNKIKVIQKGVGRTPAMYEKTVNA